MEKAELYKLCSELQAKLDRETSKCRHAQAVAFDLMMEGKPPIKDSELKADNFYLQAELKKVIAQRDELKKKLLKKEEVDA